MTARDTQLPRILIVDDEAPVRELLAEVLAGDYDCTGADSAETALEIIASGDFAVVISDIDMTGISGIEMVPRIHQAAPDAVILMVSGNLSIDYAVRAIRVGAFDYITKPFELDAVELAVRRAAEHHGKLVEKKQYEADLEELVKQRTEELNFLIYHDSLTNLPNRVLFEDRVAAAVLRAKNGSKLAILFLSLDAFDKVQDSFGHTAADKVLEEIAARIDSAVPENACLSRLQGEDFAVLITDAADLDDYTRIADRIREKLMVPVRCADTEIFLTASIGICIFPEDGGTPEELMRNAGNALRRAREAGGDTVQFYSDGCNTNVESRLKLEAELRRAFERDEFRVHYQPKVCIATGAITGVEALVRWDHPERGFISPADFIPLAEDTGLIVPLGEVVLRTACSDGSKWHEWGFPLEIAVNVSTRQLKQGDLAERFEMIVRETGFDPNFLNLELTESSMMENAEASVAIMERLKTLGIRVSLDDFGTGYSSLAHRKKLPIDQLKIDREFVSDVGSADTDDAVLTLAIVNLAHNLGLKVIAEGVENEAQLDYLKSIGCDEYQGFYFSRPVAAEEITGLISPNPSAVQDAHVDESRPSILPHPVATECAA